MIFYNGNRKHGKSSLFVPVLMGCAQRGKSVFVTVPKGELFEKLSPYFREKGHHGLFLKARENLWGNIAIGLGNRLAIFQNKLVDAITRNHDVDLLPPGKQPCAYFVIISAQDSAYRFLSLLFFSLAFPRLSDYARLHGKNGRLPVLVNFCLDEYCNIGYMDGIADALNSIRGFNMSCKVTISVTNNQMPLMPLFSPVYTSTRPYSQTRSNTQWKIWPTS